MDCNVTVSNRFHGVIESPNYPFKNSLISGCQWTLKAPTGNKINITFSSFDMTFFPFRLFRLMRDSKCQNNNITITEKGNLINSPENTLGVFCDSKIPTSLSSNQDTVIITYNPHPVAYGNSFRLEWIVSGCGGQLKGKTFGILTSPNYPKPYNHSISCEWFISVPPFKNIQFHVEDLDLELSRGCAWDALEIYSGDDDSDLILRMCQKQSAGTIIRTPGHKAFVRFRSDHDINGKGFRMTYSTTYSDCGGRMRSTKGVIFSKNFPKNYENNLECEYFIDLPVHQRINLTFEVFDVHSDINCNDSYVEVFDDYSSSTSLGKFCGKSLPEPLLSRTNGIRLLFKTGKFPPSQGFRAKYAPSCGLIVNATEDTGKVTFTGLSFETDPYENCSWTIFTDKLDAKISLTFQLLQLSEQKESLNELLYGASLNIYSGDDATGSLLMTLTGHRTPSTIYTDSSSVYLELIGVSYSSQFELDYSILDNACGGSLLAESGSFTTPNYPSGYSSNIECIWTLQASPGNIYLLNFESFELYESEFCNEDYLEIREDGPNGQLLKLSCDDKNPPDVTSNSLWIKFQSGDTNSTSKGFLAHFSLQDMVELNNATGTVSSPTYPKYITRMKSYYWRIMVDPGYQMSIKFSDLNIQDFVHCEEAFLKIYDGFDDKAPLLMTVCGTDIPKPKSTASNVAYVHFAPVRLSLFSFTWEQLYARDLMPEEKDSGNENCTGIVSISTESQNSSFVLNSPGYPNGYENNLRCTWIFKTTPYNHLSVIFSFIDLERSWRCNADRIEVYSGSLDDEDSWSLEKSICTDNDTNVAVDASSKMKITFITDHTDNRTGFSASVFSVCGGNLTAQRGVIEFDGEFATCDWRITARNGRTIKLLFLEFNLLSKEEGKCDSNYLIVRNGGSEESPFLGSGKFCGLSPPDDLQSTGNQLYLKITHGGLLDSKVVILYWEVSLTCGDTITLTNFFNNTEISSPNHPNVPPPYSECVWRITAPPGESIQIDVDKDFDLTYSSGCELEYLELRDGATEIAPLLGRFCASRPKNQETSGNSLYVKYFTMLREPTDGFRAKIRIAKCGGTMYAMGRGNIVSPGYPNSYDENLDCVWKLVGPDSIRFKLTLNYNLGVLLSPVNCSRNNIDVLNITSSDKVSTSEDPQLMELLFCGIGGNTTIVTTPGNEVLIHFKSFSQRLNRVRTFSIAFDTVFNNCGGTLSAPSGEIKSQGYPTLSGHLYCNWRIQAPVGNRVTVVFSDFDIGPNSANRSRSFIQSNRVLFFNDFSFSNEITSLNGEVPAGTTVESTQHKMLIFFATHSPRGHRGFVATYFTNRTAACGGQLAGKEGIISIPTTLKSFICTWEYENEKSSTLALIIQGEINSDSPSCDYGRSYIALSERSNPVSDDQFCGAANVIPRIMLTPRKFIAIKAFKNSVLLGGTSFNNTKIQWKVHDCGGMLSGFSGNISSPNFPNFSTGNIYCAWQLRVTIGQVIKVKFDTFDLDSNCDDSYVAIYNGRQVSSPVILHQCGNVIPQNLTSQDNYLFISFVSRSNNTRNKFRLFYEVVQLGCGGTFHDNQGIIESQNYPNSYKNNIECEWQIWTSPGYHLGLTFGERFQIEESVNCKNDFVEVYDFIDSKWEIIGGRFCGRHPPPVINSTTHKVKIMFRTNDNVVGDGFKLTWNTNCGGLIKVSPEVLGGYINSPGYPENYKGPVICNYTLLAPDRVIDGKFESFELEESISNGCMYDKVEIKINQVPGKRIQLKYEYCGNMTPPAFASFEKVTIIFYADISKDYSGFSFKFSFDVCGGNVTEPTVIQPSSNSSSFHPGFQCQWNITAPKDKIIKIKFENIELPANRDCRWSSIQIYDSIPQAANENSTLLARLCGFYQNPPTFRTTSNSATLNFIPGRFSRSQIFSAIISFEYGKNVGCGGDVQLGIQESKIISLPRLTNYLLSEPYLDCHWTIKAEPLHKISLKIRSLKLSSNCSTNGTKCNCNYIEIHDGLALSDNFLGRYCGVSMQSHATVSSSGSFLSLTAVLNKPNSNQAFEVEVSSTTSTCGEPLLTVNDTLQELVSPGYPSSYPPNLNCEWILRTQYKEVDIHITDLDLQESATCSADRLELNEVMSDSAFGTNIVVSGNDKLFMGESLRRPISSTMFQGFMENGRSIFCGKMQGFDYYSHKDVKVKFISDSSGSSKGFKLRYSIATCNRNYTSEQGRIIKVFSLKPCNVIIDVSHINPNATISIYFSMMIVDYSPDCNKGKLEVFDGEDDKANKLLSSCGYTAKPPPKYTTGPKALIKFSNTGDISGHLELTYTSTDKGQGCGGRIYNSKGYFTSPFYPGNYRNESVCRWDITVPVGNVPELQFIEFQLGRKITCDSNYVEIYDVAEETGIEILQISYCGEDKPRKIEGKGRTIVLKYVTNIHNDGIGWEVRFMAKKVLTIRDYELNHPIILLPGE